MTLRIVSTTNDKAHFNYIPQQTALLSGIAKPSTYSRVTANKLIPQNFPIQK
jgi:hypothetical protein